MEDLQDFKMVLRHIEEAILDRQKSNSGSTVELGYELAGGGAIVVSSYLTVGATLRIRFVERLPN